MNEIELKITAADGFLLTAVLYSPDSDVVGVVIFNPGGGVAASRYRNFLRHLACRQLAVIAYDYRGIGRSTPPSRQHFDAGIEDWAEFDQASVINFARDRFPDKRISSVSHSIGCMIAASAPNANEVDQMVFVAPHTGYWGDYHRWLQLPMGLMWHALMPAIANIFGYFPASRLGLGDDFPRRFALQWSARLKPDFSYGAYGGSVEREYRLLDRMTILKNRALVIASFDDCFATDAAIRRFLSAMPNVRSIRRELGDPKKGATLGHWGFFRRRNSCYWDIASSFLLESSRRFRLAAEWANNTQRTN